MRNTVLESNRPLLARFPKIRAELPQEYKAFHTKFYQAAREGQHAGASIALRLERWMHRKVLADRDAFPLLELGAGTLNHVQFEPTQGDYDVIEPMAVLYADRPECTRIRDTFADTADVPVERRYKRIVSVAVLEHVTNLPEVIAQACLLLTPNGSLRSGIPSEGGLLWYLAYTFGTGVSFRLKYGLDYGVYQRYEHVNKAWEIVAVIRMFFKRVKISRFPLPGVHFSFYTYLHAEEPDREAAAEFLARKAYYSRADQALSSQNSG